MDKVIPIDEEFTFDDTVIMSETDLKGVITYVNRKFCEVSGYDRNELKGKNHNIIRHPDMPKAVFKSLWDTITSGKEWTGIFKNIRKDGRYYWVHTYVSPIIKEGTLVGFSAARRVATKLEVEEAKEEYAKL